MNAAEHARRVAPATDAGDDGIGQGAVVLVHELPPTFVADAAVEVADHRRERVRADDAAEDVVRLTAGAHPITHRLVRRVFERSASAVDFDDVGPEEPHAKDVQFLSADVFAAHVDVARQPEFRRRRRRRNAVLAGPGFGDEAGLAHPLGEQRLADGVVDLVGTRVEQVFALHPDACPADVMTRTVGRNEQRGATGELAEVNVQFGAERGVGLGFFVGGVELVERADERLGDEGAAEVAEVAAAGGRGCVKKSHESL